MSSSSAAAVGEVEGHFTKPGQRFATPSPGQGGRVFYESLYREKPSSPMALTYVIEYGVLLMDEAKREFPAYHKLKLSKKSEK